MQYTTTFITMALVSTSESRFLEDDPSIPCTDIENKMITDAFNDFDASSFPACSTDLFSASLKKQLENSPGTGTGINNGCNNAVCHTTWAESSLGFVVPNMNKFPTQNSDLTIGCPSTNCQTSFAQLEKLFDKLPVCRYQLNDGGEITYKYQYSFYKDFCEEPTDECSAEENAQIDTSFAEFDDSSLNECFADLNDPIARRGCSNRQCPFESIEKPGLDNDVVPESGLKAKGCPNTNCQTLFKEYELLFKKLPNCVRGKFNYRDVFSAFNDFCPDGTGEKCSAEEDAKIDTSFAEFDDSSLNECFLDLNDPKARRGCSNRQCPFESVRKPGLDIDIVPESGLKARGCPKTNCQMLFKEYELLFNKMPNCVRGKFNYRDVYSAYDGFCEAFKEPVQCDVAENANIDAYFAEFDASNLYECNTFVNNLYAPLEAPGLDINAVPESGLKATGCPNTNCQTLFEEYELLFNKLPNCIRGEINYRDVYSAYEGFCDSVYYISSSDSESKDKRETPSAAVVVNGSSVLLMAAVSSVLLITTSTYF